MLIYLLGFYLPTLLALLYVKRYGSREWITELSLTDAALHAIWISPLMLIVWQAVAFAVIFVIPVYLVCKVIGMVVDAL